MYAAVVCLFLSFNLEIKLVRLSSYSGHHVLMTLATTSIVLELMGVVVLPTETDNSYASLLHQPQYNQDQDQEMTSTQSRMPTHLLRCL